MNEAQRRIRLIEIEQEQLRLQMEMEQQPVAQQQAPGPNAPGSLLSDEDRVRAGFAQGFGLPPEQIDYDNSVGANTRVALGAMTDSPDERRAYIEKVYPGAKVVQSGDYFGMQSAPGEAPMFFNPPGLDWGDVAEFGGATAPPVLGAIAGAGAAGLTSFTGPGALMTGAATGVAATQAAREGLQHLAGTQRESLGDASTRIGIESALEFLPVVGKAIARGYRAYKGEAREVAEQTGNALWETLDGSNPKDLQQMMAIVKDSGDLTLPDLKLLQQSDNKVLEKVGKQAIQYDEGAQKILLDQLNELGRITRGATPDTGMRSADEIVQGAAAKQYESGRELVPTIEPGVPGQSTITKTKKGLDKRKTAMQNQYAELDKVIAKEEPVFDLTEAVRLSQPRKAPVQDAKGGVMNAAAPEKGELGSIKSMLREISPVQDAEYYESVKGIRTRLGNLLEMTPAQAAEGGVDLAEAKQLYGALTSGMRSGTGSEAFEQAARKADDTAQKYYDSYHLGMVPRALDAEKAGDQLRLWSEVANDPAAWNPKTLQLMGGVKDGSKIASGIQRAILDTEDPVAALKKWRKVNPAMTRTVFGGKQGLDAAMENAKVLKDLAGSMARQASEASTTRTGFARERIAEHAANLPRGVKDKAQHMSTLAGQGTPLHTAYRSSVLEDLFEGTLKEHTGSGAWTVDPKVLKTKTEALKKQGIYDGLLTERDRRIIEVMEAYARRTVKSGDAGTGLAVAGQIGQLFKGNPAAYGQIRLARIVANLVTRTDLPTAQFIKKVTRGRELTAPVMRTVFRTLRQGPLADWATEESEEP